MDDQASLGALVNGRPKWVRTIDLNRKGK